MKTITTILAVLFSLQVSLLCAGNDNITISTTEATSSFNMVSLAPTAPVEAIFEDMAEDNTFSGLAPVTPMSADFDDLAVALFSVNDLSPEVPSAADFSDTIDQPEINIRIRVPTTPFEADFE